jgi:hypothetical protein
LHRDVEHLAYIKELKKLDRVRGWYIPVVETEALEGHFENNDRYRDKKHLYG